MTRDEIGQFILNKEARRDSRGHLVVYHLPKGDGGGEFEVAGINDRYHETQAWTLRRLIEAGNFADAENEAREYLLQYTEVVVNWHPDMRVRAYLRDCAFNRGPGGAAVILQHALWTAGSYEMRIDGLVGPGTKAAARKHAAEDLVFRLTLSRQWYERYRAHRDETSQFWRGLVNRWVNVAQVCLSIGDGYDDRA